MIKSDRVLDEHIPKFNRTPSILIVVAPYYSLITNQLIVGAKIVLKKVNAKVDLIEVPGALEIPTAIKLTENHFSGFIALGCVIRGETSHYETVASESSRGLSNLGQRGICVGNGILTVENLEQAKDRANPLSQNKGGAASLAALNLIALKQKFS